MRQLNQTKQTEEKQCQQTTHHQQRLPLHVCEREVQVADVALLRVAVEHHRGDAGHDAAGKREREIRINDQH